MPDFQGLDPISYIIIPLGKDVAISLILLKSNKKNKCYLEPSLRVVVCLFVFDIARIQDRFMTQHSKSSQFQHCDRLIDKICSGRNEVGKNYSLLF